MSDNETAKADALNRRRRGRRGGRGRGRGRGPHLPASPAEAPAKTVEETTAPTDVAPEAIAPADNEPTAIEPLVPSFPPPPPPPEEPPLRPPLAVKASQVARQSEPESHGSALSRAIEQISEIVESLKRALDQMEEVLELTELAERQKTADEQEIDSLRRVLRQLQSPRLGRSRGPENPESPHAERHH